MRWLHLSDIHYNPQNAGRSTEQLRDRLPAYIRDNGITADHLFVTGDFRHAAQQPESENAQAAREAADFMLNIAQAAGIPPDHIHIVPGNHDLVRTSDTDRIQRIQKSYQTEDGRFSPEDQKFLTDRFAFFRTVQAELSKRGYRSPWKENADPSALHAVRILDDCALLYLNTSVLCNSNKDRGNLLLGNLDLYRALRTIRDNAPDKPVVVLAHHGLDNLRQDEKQTVEGIFKDFPVTLYLCGDAHETWQRNTNGLYEITMGCLVWDKDVEIVFSTGELPAGTLPWSVTAHEWDARYQRWDEYRHFNQELRDAQTGVSRQGHSSAPQAKLVTRDRPMQPSGAFVGRVEKMAEIERSFRGGDTMVILRGMGGLGKSEICRKLFHTYTQGSGTRLVKTVGWLTWQGSVQDTLYGQFPPIKEENA